MASEEILRRCELEDVLQKIQRNRLRWFGDVKRAGEESNRRCDGNGGGYGRRPPGRPKKSWRRCIMEDMKELGIREDMADNRDEWRRVIACRNQ